MQLTPQNLSAQGYTQLEALNHSELIPFVMRCLRKRNFPTVFFFVFNVLAGIGMMYLLFDHQKGDYGIGKRLLYICYGFCVSFLFIPLHEWIHVWAYRLCGAKKTSLSANWSKFYFMALAHDFVANARAFMVIALAPFVIISSLLLTGIFFGDVLTQLLCCGALFAHSTMCAGDFGLLGYFAQHGDQKIVTYDDVEKGISYFYGKPIYK
jgi:hypothetical protein